MRVRSLRRPSAAFVAGALCIAFACLGEPPTDPAAAPAAPAAAEQGTADPEAAALAARVLDAMGGEEAWAQARFLRFGFAGRRQHAWDRATGMHRVEGQTQEGESYVAIQDLDSREGEVWLDGERATGERAAELLENAYGAWVNDTYWLLMPTKLRDPGVTLTHHGTREIEGTAYEVLHLSFAGVGLTPGDQYWAYVHPETGLMEYWAFLLESMEPDAEPVLWRWTGWQEHAGIRLAGRREQVGGERVLELAPIEVSRQVPAGVFDGP